jgi:pyrroloquinoline-quinone synthase
MNSVTEVQANALLNGDPLLRNAWFIALQDGSMSRESFVRSQQQFFFAVGYFSRVLAALTARLPTAYERQVLVHNLAEEHGFDEADPAKGIRTHLAHEQSFLLLLQNLGVNRKEMISVEPQAPVQAFNLALLGACSMESPGFAFCALGIIEYAFADISSLIGKVILERGWLVEGELVHYCLHAAIDKRHAAELFQAAECWAQSAEPSADMLLGLKFGRYIFDRLFIDICDEAQ